jgi:hypothetical protein
MQLKMTQMSAALAALAVAVSPARALAAERTTHARMAAVRSSRSGERDDGGSVGSVTTSTSGSDDGGSDDRLTTRTSRIIPVGGQGPLLGGGPGGSSHRSKRHNRHHAAHPRTRTSGAANSGGDS